MTNNEIRDRSKRVERAFIDEANRFPNECAMGMLLRCYSDIADIVSSGFYHSGGIFAKMIEELGMLGIDVSEINVTFGRDTKSPTESVKNAIDDSFQLYNIVKIRMKSSDSPLYKIVDNADDLMRCILDDLYDIDIHRMRLHDAVTIYIERSETGDSMVGSDGDDAENPYSCLESEALYLSAHREVPKRIIYSPPATIAFWPDGTKTVARCADGDEFSEYTGLLVCIAKRHTAIPKHSMFEDVMTELLRNADRQNPERRAGDAA